MLLFGIAATGWECNTSDCHDGVSWVTSVSSMGSYPAGIWIEKPPPDPILANFFHFAAAVQEDPKHPLPQIYNTHILFCFCRFGRIIGHGVFLRDWRNNQGWM